MAQTESQVVALELERVHPIVPTLFDRDGTFFAALEKRPVDVVSNRQMRIPLEIRPGGNFGYFNPDGGDLGRGDAPSFDKAVITPAFIKYGVEFTTLTQWVTDDRRKSVLNNFRHLLAKSMSEFRRHCDAQCMTAGNAVLGTITTVNTAAGVDTLTLTTDGYGVKLLRYGQTINIYDATLATDRTPVGNAAGVNGSDGVKISFHDLVNKTIKIPSIAALPAGPAVAGDLVVAQGQTATPPVGIKGVPYHNSNASTGTWLGFDRSVTPEIRANRVSGLSANLTLPSPRLALNKVGDRIGIDNMKKFQAWMHPCQSQAYEQLGFLVTQLNSTGEGKGLDLYFGGAQQMAGAPVKKSFLWDKTRIDFIGLDVWGRAEMTPPGFYKPEGQQSYVFEIRGASGGIATSNIFYICAAFDVYMNNPAGGSYIDLLKVPAGY